MKIGIIGGVSPNACSIFYNDLCKKYRDRNFSYPELLIYSIKITKEIEDQFINNNITEVALQNVKFEINNACIFFEKNAIECVTICCNTLSDIFYNIARNYKFKLIITPVIAVHKRLQETPYLILGTRYTNDKLYADALHLDDYDQTLLDYYLQDNINMKNPKIDINDILNKYNCENIVLGCTDIKKQDLITQKKIIDPSDYLLEKLISYMEEK